MTAKEFLNGKTLTEIELVGDQVINLVINEFIIGLDVNTSDILFGTALVRTNEFELNGDNLTFNNVSIDLSTINVLWNEDNNIDDSPNGILLEQQN
jgi:hypothetical protein